MGTQGRRVLWLLSVGAVSLGVYAFLTYKSYAPTSLFHFIGLYSIAFFLFILAAYIVWPKPFNEKRSTLAIILFFAISFRFIAIVGQPLFENDMHRYLWDGKVSVHGINPYFYPPNDYQLTHLRDKNWEEINYKNIPTIYPPLAQAIFHTSWVIAPNSSIALKSVFFLFDLGVLICLVFMLRLFNIPSSRIIIYAWNPLVIKEFANSGHLDVAAIFFVTLFCLLSIKGWKSLSAITLALAILVKFYPFVLLPALIRYYRVKHFMIIGLVLILGYIPFWSAQELIFDGLWTYAKHWEFNDSGYVLLTGFLKIFIDSPQAIAKGLILVGLIWLGVSRSRDAIQDDLLRLKIFFYIIGALLIFSPTVDTWYMTWIIPFLCFFPAKSWILLTGTAVLAYCYYWKNQDFWWIRTLEYAPFYILLIREMVLSKWGSNLKVLKRLQIA